MMHKSLFQDKNLCCSLYKLFHFYSNKCVNLPGSETGISNCGQGTFAGMHSSKPSAADLQSSSIDFKLLMALLPFF